MQSTRSLLLLDFSVIAFFCPIYRWDGHSNHYPVPVLFQREIYTKSNYREFNRSVRPTPHNTVRWHGPAFPGAGLQVHWHFWLVLLFVISPCRLYSSAYHPDVRFYDGVVVVVAGIVACVKNVDLIIVVTIAVSFHLLMLLISCKCFLAKLVVVWENFSATS